jgi:hypothetical protein
MNVDFFIKSEIEDDIRRITEILASSIFAKENFKNPLVRSAFIETLISLRDLMYKTEKYVSKIDFDDDVVQTDDIEDVTDLIKYVRDALCHLDSDNHYLEKGNIKATYNIAYGKANLLSIGEFKQISDYEDDVCFFFGSQKIYLKRHIVRAFELAKDKLLPILNSS